MANNFSLKDWITLTILFLIGMWLWTLPIQSNPLPFGEGDAAWHFANGDYAAETDHSYWRLPNYIGMWYYDFNSILGVNALEYPPSYHLNYAFANILGGARVVPVYIWIAISCFLAVFTVYFLLRKFYGFSTALLGATGMLFSIREIMVYLWGQRPTLMSFALVPLALYCFYRYLINHLEDEEKPVYFYSTIGLLLVQYLIHPQGFLLSFLTILIFTIIASMKFKKFPINGTNYKHLFAGLAIFLIIAVPFFTIYAGAKSGTSTDITITEPSRLLSWFKVTELYHGYPDIYFDNAAIYGVWLLPLLGIGILSFLIKRKNYDFLMLSWLIALYILLHLDVIGIFYGGRVTRMLAGETALFYSIAAIGFIRLFQVFKLKQIVNTAVFLAIGFLFFSNGLFAYSALKDAYAFPLRVSEGQIQAADWIKENLPDDAQLIYVGTLTYPKQRFMYIWSHRYGHWSTDPFGPEHDIRYALFDYSDAVATMNAGRYLSIEKNEFKIENMSVLLYNESYIKIYGLILGDQN